MWTRRCSTRSERGRASAGWLPPGGWLVVVALLVVWPGCLFTPRDAPPPCTPGVDPGCRTPVPFKDPLTPETVRDNIQAAVRKKGFDGPTLENYERSLNDLFAYLPDAGTALTAPPCGGNPFFLEWGKTREVQFMRKVLEVVGSNVVPDSASIVFTVYAEDPTYNNTIDRKRYNVQYTMTLVYPASSPRGIECYGANAKWDLIGGSTNNWSLLRWEDLEPVPSPSCRGSYMGTMGVLRVLEGECP